MCADAVKAMISAKEVLSALSLDNYESIFNDLGATNIIKKETYWMLPTICHNLDEEGASHKLYFYLDTRTTFCFTECQKSRDIFDLVADRWQLEGKDNFSFPDVLRYICALCGINNAEKDNSHKINRQGWKNRLAVYKPTKKSQYLGKHYDKTILKYLTPYYPDVFIHDGISIETMQRFGIAYYPPLAQITIPVYDDIGQLIGIHCRNLRQSELDKGKKYIPLRTVGGLDYRFKSHEVLYGFNMNQPMIQQKKEIQLFESPKAVLQMDTMYNNQTTAVGMFGMNLGKMRKDMILRTGVSEVIIGIDKDYQSTDSAEFDAYVATVQKIAKLFRGYCKVSVLYDANNLLGYKDAPTDKGREVYEELYHNRLVVE